MWFGFLIFSLCMEKQIPEIQAREILISYEGYNNQILEWKHKHSTNKHYQLSRTQCDYILKFHERVPKVAKKYLQIAEQFGDKLMEDRLLTKPPKQIWVEKLLCDSDKAFHIWGNLTNDMKPMAMWIPKASIIPEERKLNRVIDYSPYSERPPMTHQKIAIEKLLANDRFILADDMGVGKTTSAVIASVECDVKKVLIVCPASLKINWKREIENYSDSKILVVEGKKWGSTFKYYIINYDILKNFHSTENVEDDEAYQTIVKENFELAIVDEAHYISNSTAQRTKILNEVLQKIPKVWLLTGTPMTSRPINYYNLLKIVNSPLTINWKTYVRRYCAGYQFTVGGRRIWNTSGSSNLDELREQSKAFVLRRMKTEILDLPEKIISPVFLELKNSFYDDELSEFLRITEDNKEKESITVTLNRLMKLRQLIAIEKVEYTCELIDRVLEQERKVIVFTNFTMSLDMLHEKYKKKSVILDGRMSKERRQDSVDRFQNDDKIKIFISNIKAGGVGITLTAAEVVIMNDLSFVPADHSQAEDRAYRYGQQNSVLVYYPIFENTIEMTIYNILQKKKGIIDQVMGDGEYSESFASELVKSIK
jgi:SWI/SNF-related matrix-associated actin-dependent regulator of chromatin subfamily A-like protein 1